jgi:hypothetical protein
VEADRSLLNMMKTTPAPVGFGSDHLLLCVSQQSSDVFVCCAVQKVFEVSREYLEESQSRRSQAAAQAE